MALIDTVKKLFKIGDQNKAMIVGSVVERTKKVEIVLEKIITTYIEPKESKYDFVRNIILSNYFLDFGKKINLFMYINKMENWIEKKDKNEFNLKIKSVARIRNAFAHDYGKSKISTNEKGELNFEYEVKHFQGEDFHTIEYKDSLKSFNENQAYVLEILNGVLKKLTGKEDIKNNEEQNIENKKLPDSNN